MTAFPAPKVALLYPGDRAARDRADPAASSFAALGGVAKIIETTELVRRIEALEARR